MNGWVIATYIVRAFMVGLIIVGTPILIYLFVDLWDDIKNDIENNIH